MVCLWMITMEWKLHIIGISKNRNQKKRITNISNMLGCVWN